jgi:hypothetical protein
MGGRVVVLTLAVALVAATPAAAAWRPTTTLDPTPDNSLGSPSPAFDPAGRFSVAFGAPGPAEVVATKSPGEAFSSVNLGPPGSGDLIADPSGRLSLFRVRHDGMNLRIEVLDRPLGEAFAAGQFLSTAGTSANDFHVDSNAAGATAVVWTYQAGGADNVRGRYRAAGATGWGPVQILGTAQLGTLRNPQVDVGPDGSAAVIWAESGGGDRIYAVNASDTAGTFGSEKEYVYDNGVATHGSDVAVLTDGGAIAVFDPPEDPPEIARRAPGAATFATATEPLPELGESAHPDVERLPDGGALIAWGFITGTSGVSAMTIRGAERGPVQELETEATIVQPVLLKTNERGDALLTWSRNTSPVELEGSFRPAGGTFSAATPLTAPGDPFRPFDIALDEEGNGAVGVLYAEDSTSDWIRQLATFDPAGPRIGEVVVPANGASGTPVAMSAQAADVLGSVAAYEWDFGDGATATGAAVEHTYAVHGPHTVTLRAVDDLGNATSLQRAIEVADGIAPALSAALSKRSVRRGKRARITATLSEAAQLRVTARRLLPGRRKGRRCVSRRKRGKRCTVRRMHGTVTRDVAVGDTRLRISPRFAGRRLKVGRYALRVGAIDAAGNAAPAQRLVLRVRKPKRRR